MLPSTGFGVPKSFLPSRIRTAIHCWENVRGRSEQDCIVRVRAYKFDDTRSLCQTVLNEEDEMARQGAQMVLNWLDGKSGLLRASQRDPASETQQLLVAYEGKDMSQITKNNLSTAR